MANFPNANDNGILKIENCAGKKTQEETKVQAVK